MKNQSNITPRINYTVSVANPTPFTELTVTVNNVIENALEIDRTQRVYQFKIRQSWIINNCQIISKNKKNPTDKSPKIIEDLLTVNTKLVKEISHLRQASEFLKEAPLLDTLEFQEYFKVQEQKITIPQELSNEELVKAFSKYIASVKTTEAIDILKPMLANHLYSTRKMVLKD